MLRDGQRHDATLGFHLTDGSLDWYSVRAAPVDLPDGTTGVVMSYDDVTQRHAERRQLALAERNLRLTFEHAPIGVAIVAPDGTLVQANAALCDLLGREDQLAGAGTFWHLAHDDDREEDGRLLSASLAGTLDRYLVERRFPHVSGRWLWTELSVALVRDDAGMPLHFIAQLVDLSAHRALQAELRAAANEDALTGLVNRRALAERLGHAQARRRRDGGEIGLLYVDLNRFKAVNDTHGHEVGDRVLVETARRLLDATREVDTVCRMGGDEFVVLCAPVDGWQGLQELAARLGAMPPVSVMVAHENVDVSLSIGAALVGCDDDLDAALHRADAAMYDAKRAMASLR